MDLHKEWANQHRKGHKDDRDNKTASYFEKVEPKVMPTS